MSSWPSIVCPDVSSFLSYTARIVRVEPLKPIYQQQLSDSFVDQALYFQKEALALRTPHTKILGDLREWIRRPTMGFIHIMSKDWQTWDYYDVSDLITFENSTMDRFTSLVTYTVVDIYHSLIGRHIHVRLSRQ